MRSRFDTAVGHLARSLRADYMAAVLACGEDAALRVLHPLDVYVADGIRMTTVARTLLDLAPSLSLPDLTRACHEAAIHHRTTPAQVLACMRRNPRRPGCGRLRTALGSDVTLSSLEDSFLALLRRHRLPLRDTQR